LAFLDALCAGLKLPVGFSCPFPVPRKGYLRPKADKVCHVTLTEEIKMLRTALILSALTLSAAPAMADPESWVVECASNSPGPWDGSMFCNEGKMLEVSAPNLEQKMLLRIGAPTTHCSEVSYLINRLPGGADPIAIVERLGPGEDKIVELGDGWAEEGTYITVTGIGHVGGCNAGELGSWGAVTEITPLP
jgi:hypothetical protein